MVVTVKQRIQEILDMIPHAKVKMCWIPGEENSSDPVWIHLDKPIQTCLELALLASGQMKKMCVLRYNEKP